MNIDMRTVSTSPNLKEVIFKDGDNTLNIGVLDKKEQAALARQFLWISSSLLAGMYIVDALEYLAEEVEQDLADGLIIS